MLWVCIKYALIATEFWANDKKGYSKVTLVLRKGSNTYMAAILSYFPLQMVLFYRWRIMARLMDLWFNTDMIWKPRAATENVAFTDF